MFDFSSHQPSKNTPSLKADVYEWELEPIREEDSFPLCNCSLLSENDYEQEFRFLRWMRSIQGATNAPSRARILIVSDSHANTNTKENMMCNDIQFLAHLDNIRWIGICEHGTIHLYWDHVVLFLSPNELYKLGWSLDRNTVLQDAVMRQRPWWVEESSQHQGVFTLWIANRYAIVFHTADFTLFGSMVCRALENLDHDHITRLSTIPIQIEETQAPCPRKGVQSSHDVIQFSRN